MKSFKQFLTEAKQSINEDDNDILSYLKKKYNLVNDNLVRIVIRTFRGKKRLDIYQIQESPDDGFFGVCILKYKEVIELNDKIKKFLQGEGIKRVNRFVGGVPSCTNVDITNLMLLNSAPSRSTIYELSPKALKKISDELSSQPNIKKIAKDGYDFEFEGNKFHIKPEEIAFHDAIRFYIDLESIGNILKEEVRTISSQNKTWGFYNELYSIFDGDVNKIKTVWKEIFELISNITNMDSKQIRDFLDSRGGRHLADEFWKDIADGNLTTAFNKKYDTNKFLKAYKSFI